MTVEWFVDPLTTTASGADRGDLGPNSPRSAPLAVWGWTYGGVDPTLRRPPRNTMLEPFPEDWRRALVVVAHPDDMEYGGAAAIAAWTDAGKEVAYVLVSRGEAGIEGTAPEIAGPLREDEQRASCDRVGVADVTFLGFPDSNIQDTDELRSVLAKHLRAHRPDLVITLNFRATWGGDFANQDDHINTGTALVAAVREVGGVRWIAASNSPAATHAKDVSGLEDLAVAALRDHGAYLRGLGGEEESLSMLRQGLADGGEQLGVRSAVTFELIDPTADAETHTLT